jgi:adenylylsulfate reductase, subunit B
MERRMYSCKINYGPTIDYRHCNGCRRCYDQCPMDIFGWNEEEQRPTVEYPGECWFCCFCEVMCPQVAIDVKLPLHHVIDFGIDPRTVTSLVDEFTKKEG